MLQSFGYIAGILSIFCYIPYLKDIFQLKTKPERASWFIFAVQGTIAFFSQLAKGATDSLWLTGVQTTAIIVIFLLSLKFGVGGLTKKDILALLCVFVGLILWFFTKEAAFALFIVIFVDSIAVLLTVQKSYQDPGSETLVMWLFAGIAGFFAILSVGKLDFILLSYPIYVLVANLLIVSAILAGSTKVTKKKNYRKS